MLTPRSLIVSLIFFFSLAGSVNALTLCSLEKQVSTKSNGQIPGSIFCLDDEGSPFRSEVYQGYKKIYFPEIQDKAGTAHHVAFLQMGFLYPNRFGSLGTVLLPLSIPIYQLKTVYRI